MAEHELSEEDLRNVAGGVPMDDKALLRCIDCRKTFHKYEYTNHRRERLNWEGKSFKLEGVNDVMWGKCPYCHTEQIIHVFY